jgi:hypothetical protein
MPYGPLNVPNLLQVHLSRHSVNANQPLGSLEFTAPHMQLKPVADLHEAPRKVEKQSQTCRGAFLTCSVSNALVWERSWWSIGRGRLPWPPASALARTPIAAAPKVRRRRAHQPQGKRTRRERFLIERTLAPNIYIRNLE